MRGYTFTWIGQLLSNKCWAFFWIKKPRHQSVSNQAETIRATIREYWFEPACRSPEWV